MNLVISTDTRRATGYQVPTVKVPLQKDALRITLTLPEPVTYRIQWEDIKGRLTDLEIEKQEANSVSVIIPAGDLTPGQYALTLFRKNSNGTEERVPGSYQFIVE